MNRYEMMKKMHIKPNFIVIHTDQQRADCVNAYGKRKGLYTPHMDSIAALGARFDSSYASCPVCIPQRLSLLTGQSPQKHGVFDNIGIPDLPLETTFPAEMGKAGYQTALFGRTMHTYPFSNPYGFQEYHPGDPSNNQKDKDEFFNFIEEHAPAGSGGYNGNGTYNNSRGAAAFHLEDRFHQTMWTTNRAVEYLQERVKDKKPFLLFAGYYAPHSPHNPPREWMDYYMNMEGLDEPAIAEYDVKPVSNGNMISPYVDLQGEELRRARAGYYGNISFIDMQIGRILNQLMFLPFTYVIFTSDHGEMLGDHYRMHKGVPWQGSVHTPLMIYGPGIPQGQVIHTPAAWQDIMPTVLELAGIEIPESVDGVSFAQTLLGNSTKKEREYLHGECVISTDHFREWEKEKAEGNLALENGAHYLTDGAYKYIWYTTSGREQLFDLTVDEKELHDLSKLPEYQCELEKWRALLIKELDGREEGFSDGSSLISSPEKALSTKMEKLRDKRLEEGKQIAYYYAGSKKTGK